MEPQDLAEALVALARQRSRVRRRRFLDAHPELASNQAVELTRHTADLLRRDGAQREAEALDEIRAVLQRRIAILERLGPDVARRFLEAFNVVAEVHDRAGETRDPKLIDEAAARWRTLLGEDLAEVAPADLWLGALAGAGEAFERRYALRHELEDLEAAAGCWRSVLDGLDDDAPERPIYLRWYGRAMLTGYQVVGNADLLEAALETFRSALRTELPDTTTRNNLLSDLAVAYRERYLLTGVPADLDSALDAQTEILRTENLGSRARASSLHDTGVLLLHRYERGGDLGYLEGAIRALQGALADAPDAPFRPTLLGTFAAALHARYGVLHVADDLDQAIAFWRSSLEGDNGQATRNRRGNLAAALVERRRPEDIDEAVELLDDLVRSTPAGLPGRASWLSNLAAALYQRSELSGDLADLQRASDLAAEAVDAVGEGPQASDSLFNLGSILAAQYDDAPTPEGAAAVSDAYRRSCQTALPLRPQSALQAARVWGDWAERVGAWPTAAEAYGYGMEATRRLSYVQLSLQRKESWLRTAADLHVRGALAHVQTGNLAAAAATLEAGRGVALGELLELQRKDLARVRARGRGDLADRFERAAAVVAEAARRDEVAADASDDDASWAERFARHARARDELVAIEHEIRSVPGLEGFHQKEPVGSPRPVDTTAVYLAAHGDTGFAVVVPSGAAPTHVPLPRLTDGEVREHTQRYLGAYDDRHKDRAAWLAACDDLTKWLWDAAMGPLVAAVGSGNEALLVPTGLLGLLPLHAAWTHDSTRLTGRRYALDDLGIAYAPNLRSVPPRPTVDSSCRILVVDDPQPVSAEPLKESRYEAAAARAAFTDGRIIPGEDATHTEIVRALPDYEVAHFSCHGRPNYLRPLQAGVVLSGDVRLTVADLLGIPLDKGRLAVLSSCETSVPGARVPDEAVSLPTALLIAGFDAVVAALWAVPQTATLALMLRCYDLMVAERAPVREALRRAQQWLRDATNADLWSYASAALEPDTSSWIPRETALRLLTTAATADPGKRAYDHPAHWAAFVYVGA